jgi:hypothetical protein
MNATEGIKKSFKGASKDLADPMKMFARFFKFSAYASLFLVQEVWKRLLPHLRNLFQKMFP